MDSKELYNVYCIDLCFESYASYDVFIGASSIEELKVHWKEIFPDVVETIEDEEDLCYAPDGLKIGDTYNVPYFSESQMQKIFDDSVLSCQRIRKLENLYTDKPYTILNTFSYYE